MEQPSLEIATLTDERSGSDLSPAFGIAIGLALGAALQVGLFVGLYALWQRLVG